MNTYKGKAFTAEPWGFDSHGINCRNSESIHYGDRIAKVCHERNNPNRGIHERFEADSELIADAPAMLRMGREIYESHQRLLGVLTDSGVMAHVRTNPQMPAIDSLIDQAQAVRVDAREYFDTGWTETP